LKPQSKFFSALYAPALYSSERASVSRPGTRFQLNVSPTCESEGRKAIALGTASIEACKKSETEARHALARHWSSYQKADRSTCMGRISHGGHPSYVELQACVESFKRAREIREANAKGRSQHAKDKF
jgi:hypothetical protein